MEKTKISYCDSTVNLSRGCIGCELWQPARGVKKCYAGRMTNRWRGDGAFDAPVEMLPGRITKATRWSDLTGTDRPDKPWLNGMPRVIFVGDMSDSLSPAVSDDFLYTELIQGVTSELGRRHIWLWLTKQAPRLPRFDRYLREMGVDWPVNLWPGVSITSQNTVHRLDHLIETRASVRWLSLEPLLEAVDLDLFGFGPDWTPAAHEIHWIITGGESGPGAEHAEPTWFQKLLIQARQADIPFFMKQGSADWKPDYRALSAFPQDLQIREMPKYPRSIQCR